eukprot:TRINITY_DN24050_c0_g1_i1.p1 TRINITY_DN24050_c0_g1~~TRINITY_DN24050_c0_g1_i1.p1  ORF type:complete len:380 (-),score=78.98 TRINITY_DN24050_c0_g1_i1:132-1271(-)
MLYVVPADKESSKKAKKNHPSPMALATVKVDAAVPYSFDVITPQQQYYFQAFGALAHAHWVSCLRNATADCLYGSESAKNETNVSTKQLELLRAVRGNSRCCDCGSEDTDWVSINLGVLFCIECSGIHRSLGAHLSKVRGLKLDTLAEDTTSMLCSIGNEAANKLWEDCLDGACKPGPSDTREAKGDFIRQKYGERRWMGDEFKGIHDLRTATVEKMFCAVREDDTTKLSVILALTGGEGGMMFDGKDLCQGGSHARHTSLLHAACIHNCVNSAILLKNAGAQMTAVDSNGQTPLDCAEQAGNEEMCRWMLENTEIPCSPEQPAQSQDSDEDDNEMDECELNNVLREQANKVFGLGTPTSPQPHGQQVETFQEHDYHEL